MNKIIPYTKRITLKDTITLPLMMLVGFAIPVFIAVLMGVLPKEEAITYTMYFSGLYAFMFSFSIFDYFSKKKRNKKITEEVEAKYNLPPNLQDEIVRFLELYEHYYHSEAHRYVKVKDGTIFNMDTGKIVKETERINKVLCVKSETDDIYEHFQIFKQVKEDFDKTHGNVIKDSIGYVVRYNPPNITGTLISLALAIGSTILVIWKFWGDMASLSMYFIILAMFVFQNVKPASEWVANTGVEALIVKDMMSKFGVTKKEARAIACYANMHLVNRNKYDYKYIALDTSRAFNVETGMIATDIRRVKKRALVLSETNDKYEHFDAFCWALKELQKQ